MAPSPTGFVHLGTGRTALFNFLFARSQGGVFVLRIDDTDAQRDRAEYEQAIFDSFHWLGLDWDEGPTVGGAHGPYHQSERWQIYRDHALRLLESGTAYRCWCTPEELAAEREQARREGRPPRYSRRCLTNPPIERKNDPFATRLLIPEGETVIEDLVRGTVRWNHGVLSDPVIMRSDGQPLYNFTSPIDDALMEITHVLRAEEHLSNTPIQLMILQALGYNAPMFGHLPWILGQDGKKLSKRLHPEMNMALYRERGYLPEAMVNYLALLGWNPGTEQEIFSMPELIQAFDIRRVQSAGAAFDWKKLDWINGHYIRSLGSDELAGRLEPLLPELPADLVRRAAPAVQERITTLSQSRELLDYLWTDPPPPALSDEERQRVTAAAEALREVDWEPEAVETALEAVLERLGCSKNQLFKPIRLALTGKPVSPPIHHTLALLPRDTALIRLDRVAEQSAP
jgi:glutamyl-tRNA synthetase